MFGLVYRHWAWVNSHSCLFCCKKYYKALHASRSPRSVWLKPYFAPCSICLPFIQRPQFLCHSPKIWNSLWLSKRVPLLIPHLKMHLKTSKPSSSHNPSFGFCWPLCAFVIFTYLFTKHTQPFNVLLSGTTWVGRYHKKHSPTHTHPDDRTSFIIFLHLQRSIASSLFSLRAWESSRTTSLQVLFGLPLGLGPSTSYSMHIFTQSSSSFRSTCPYQRSLFCCNINAIFLSYLQCIV